MAGRDTIGAGEQILALCVGFWAGLQTVPPILAALSVRSGLAGLGASQSFSAGTGLAVLAAANPVQLALWVLAGALFALAAMSLAGVQVGPARDYYGVALLLEAVVWATFRRGFGYFLLPAATRRGLIAIAALVVLGYVAVLFVEARKGSASPRN